MELTVILVKTTKASYIVKETEESHTIAIPISQTTVLNEEVRKGVTYMDIDIPDWLAEDRGLL